MHRHKYFQIYLNTKYSKKYLNKNQNAWLYIIIIPIKSSFDWKLNQSPLLNWTPLR